VATPSYYVYNVTLSWLIIVDYIPLSTIILHVHILYLPPFYNDFVFVHLYALRYDVPMVRSKSRPTPTSPAIHSVWWGCSDDGIYDIDHTHGGWAVAKTIQRIVTKLIHNEGNIYSQVRSKFDNASLRITMLKDKVKAPSLTTHPTCWSTVLASAATTNNKCLSDLVWSQGALASYHRGY
jgi:hypothetical protein